MLYLQLPTVFKGFFVRCFRLHSSCDNSGHLGKFIKAELIINILGFV